MSLSLIQVIDYAENIYAHINSNINNEHHRDFLPLKHGEVESLITICSTIKQIIDPYYNNLFRHGIKNLYCDSHQTHNISLYNSILHCIIPNFLQILEDDKIKFISTFMNILCKDITKETKKKRKGCKYILTSNYNFDNLNINKKQLFKDIHGYKNTTDIILAISTYFSINIIIFNNDQQNIYVAYSEDHLNIYKITILLSLTHGYYEPMFFNNNKVQQHNSKIIQLLLNNEKIIRLCKDQNNKVTIGPEDLNFYSLHSSPIDDINIKSNNNKQKPNTKQDTVQIKNEYTELHDNECVDDGDNLTVTELHVTNDDELIKNKIFCKQTEEAPKTVPISLYLKLGELQNIATNHNIDITNGVTKSGKKKMKTKKQLYDEIRKVIGLE